jgi:hypothetical protein
MTVANLTPDLPESPATVRANPEPDFPAEPNLKKLTAGQVSRMFPAGRLIKKAINRRFRPVTGYAIDPKRLYYVLVNLGATEPQAFIDWLDRESYMLLGSSGTYRHFPKAARECAIFEAARAAKPQTRSAAA